MNLGGSSKTSPLTLIGPELSALENSFVLEAGRSKVTALAMVLRHAY